ncbi:MAG: hypothetical protein K2X74_22070 [Acetobacteraceae bacterium]|nr:hypothetical protein [Acetobacteraceae bacterium]
MRDPRCTQSWRPGSAEYRATVARAVAERYPDPAETDASGRLVQVRPYVRTVEVQGRPVRQQVDGHTRQGGSRREEAPPRVRPPAPPAWPRGQSAELNHRTPLANPPDRSGLPNTAFADAIAHSERSTVHAAANDGYYESRRDGYALGRYQFTPQGLQAAGWQDRTGAWTTRAREFGVTNEAAFLRAPLAQEQALRDYLSRVESELARNRMFDRAGQVLPGLSGEGVRITGAGLMAAAHRQGGTRLRAYLDFMDRLASTPPAQQWVVRQSVQGDRRAVFRSVEQRLREFQTIPYDRQRP